MSPISNAAATLYQVGTQSVFDTPVASTAKIIATGLEFAPADQVNRPRYQTGVPVRHRGGEHPVARGTRWTLPATPLSYEQLPGWLGMLIRGGVTPNFDDPEYTWNFARALNALPSGHLVTFERRLSDYSNHVDHEWPNCAATRGVISGRENADVTLMAEGFGGARADSTLTAALSAPVPEHIPFALTEMFIDDSWAAVGGTKISGQVLSWDLEIFTGAVGMPLGEGRANLDYGIRVFNTDEVGHAFTARLLMDKTRFNAERAAADGQALRAIRLGAGGTGDRAVSFDFLAKYEIPELTSVGEVNGQVVVDLVMVDATDGSNSLRAGVTNLTDEEWGWAAA